MKSVLVTGGNTGIGLALCQLLVRDHDCFVYLGSRNVERGTSAVNSIKEKVGPGKSDNIELVQIDVCSDQSVSNAAGQLKAKGVTLFGLVNNAGVGLSTANNNSDGIIQTNFYGVKKVTDAFLDLLDGKGEGRIVNVSSGVAPMWMARQDGQTKKLFSDPNITWDALEAAVKENVAAKNFTMGGYALSKAALNALTMVQSKNNPNLTITSAAPGFIDTNMTSGYGANTTPEEGCRSTIKCLFGDVTSGGFYESDGRRAPLV